MTKTIFEYLDKEQAIDEGYLKEDIKDLVIKTIQTIMPHIKNLYHIEMGFGETNQNCFQIFGIDILIDEDGSVWLMEINGLPSLRM